MKANVIDYVKVLKKTGFQCSSVGIALACGERQSCVALMVLRRLVRLFVLELAMLGIYGQRYVTELSNSKVQPDLL